MHTRSHKSFANLREFYGYCLGEHSDRTCRRLHFCGAALAALGVVGAAAYRVWWPLLAGVVVAYGFAWARHIVFEKNSPATFRHPLRSFACDFLMFRDMLMGRITF